MGHRRGAAQYLGHRVPVVAHTAFAGQISASPMRYILGAILSGVCRGRRRLLSLRRGFTVEALYLGVRYAKTYGISTITGYESLN